MTTFAIDRDNNITAFAHPHEAEAVIAEGQPFTSHEALSTLTASWPMDRFRDGLEFLRRHRPLRGPEAGEEVREPRLPPLLFARPGFLAAARESPLDGSN
jgi:hypothetical protein